MRHSIASHPFGVLWGDLSRWDKKYYQGKITLKQLESKVKQYRAKYQRDALRDEKKQTARWKKTYGLSTKPVRTGYPWILSKVMR